MRRSDRLPSRCGAVLSGTLEAGPGFAHTRVMITARRFLPLVVLVVAACVPGRRATLRPGSDVAIPRKPAAAVEKKDGKVCASVKGVIVRGSVIECSPLAPDSTRPPQPVRPQ